MRKFYALVAGILFILASTKTNAQTSPNVSCEANFEVSAESNALLTKKFTAIPWHSEQKRPVYICWNFGDGKDTCIQYTTSFTGPYSVLHHYQQTGTYEVCVKIVYEGGCQSTKCKPVAIADYCLADFEKPALTPTADPLYVTLKAIPWNSSNQKPKKICWNFGDGKDTCIEYTPDYGGGYYVRHKYNEPGQYQVCIKIFYYGECEAAKCKVVQVTRPDQCTADFERLPVTSTNNPLLAVFRAQPWNSKNHKPKTICWSFGDGKDTCIQYSENYTGNYPVYHTYREPGSYEVCVKITYYGGCEAHKCKLVEVIRPDQCTADFERLPVTSTNNPLLVVYKALPWNSNNKKPKTICWNFGDGKDTCIQYPENYTGNYPVYHIYHEPGNYEVCVKITYYGGCEAYKCKLVQVIRPDQCGADFQRVPVEYADHPLVVGFKAIPSHNNNKLPKVICWSFGDGRDTCVEYAENFDGPYGIRHRYDAAGTYNVCIKILYYGGCEAKICKTIVVTLPDECRAGFERLPVTSTNNPLLVVYKALPWNSNNKKPKTICWSFGDGKDTCIQYPENYTGNYAVYHTYREPGSYEVCIKILYYGGCEAKNCKEIIIGSFCRADFERLNLSTADNPLNTIFKAIPWHSQDKKPKSICWRFGDGKDTCIQYDDGYTGLYTVRHEYERPGNYEVCVKITYYGGCESYKCKVIQVGQPVECKADFERLPISIVNNPLHVAFKAIPWNNNNKPPREICWKFGDGTDTCIQYDDNYTGGYLVHHKYRQPGIYEVCVKINYYGGCEAKKCELVKVEGPGECRVNLFEITPSINSLQRGFYVAPHSSNDKRPVRICWYFGDGTDTCVQLEPGSIFPGLFIRHTYPAPGLYRACVKVLFEGGCIAADCDEVVIRPTTNTCGGFMTDSLVSPRTFKFKGFAIHNPDDPVIGFRWTFGDGSSATGREVTHQYNAPGNYEVCLTIKTQRGCETKICKTLQVPGITDVILQISPNPVVNTMHVLFYSTQTEPVVVKIVNGYGVLVRSWVRNATTGANNWDFNVADLPAGAYTFYVQSPNQLASRIFIKAN